MNSLLLVRFLLRKLLIFKAYKKLSTAKLALNNNNNISKFNIY